MTFYSNGTALGPPVPVDSSIVPPVASFNSTQMPLGLDKITAQYSGDANFSGSSSLSTAIDVGGTYSVTVSPTTINVASPGQSGSATLTFTAQNAFTGSGTLSPSICVNMPPNSSCSFSPSTVAFTSSTTTFPVTLTITTAGATASSRRVPTMGPGGRLSGTAAVFVFGVCFLPFGTRRRHGQALVAVVVTVLMATALSCGGGGNGSGNSGGGGGGTTGTPTGNYNGVILSVSIAGVMQDVYVNVAVQ